MEKNKTNKKKVQASLLFLYNIHIQPKENNWYSYAHRAASQVILQQLVLKFYIIILAIKKMTSKDKHPNPFTLHVKPQKKKCAVLEHEINK